MVFCPFFLFPFYWLAGFSTFMVFFVHATIHLMPNFSVFASPINLETEQLINNLDPFFFADFPDATFEDVILEMNMFPS